MILHNVDILGIEAPVNIMVCNGKIVDVNPASANSKIGHLNLSFNNAIAFPGLINSHDHLDFNLFPALGGKVFSNYTEWGKHIHDAYRDEIAAITKIPAALRYQWGVYKNLLCGVTTVVNHGEKTGLTNTPITIFEETHCLHSVQFEKQWKVKLNNPAKKSLAVNMHVGEGTDAQSSKEIDELIKFNLLKRKLIGVHGVSMSGAQAEHFEAVVWCPETNLFLLNKTAQVDVLSKHTEILFGTDSTLTGSWNIWEQLRLARDTGMLGDEGLYATLNHNPATVWKLNCGDIVTGKDADLVVAQKTTEKNSYDAFFGLNPVDILLVTHKGEISLFDEELLPQLHNMDLTGFSRVFIGDCCKYVKGDVPALIKQIRIHQPNVKFPVTINETIEA